MVKEVGEADSGNPPSSSSAAKVKPRELPDVQKVPAVYYMAHNGYADLISSLASAGYFDDYPAQSMNSSEHSLPGTTPLWAALVKGHLEAAEQFLALAGVDVKTMYNPKLAPSPLTIAGQNGQGEKVKFILNYLKEQVGAEETSRFLEVRESASGHHAVSFSTCSNNLNTLLCYSLRSSPRSSFPVENALGGRG